MPQVYLFKGYFLSQTSRNVQPTHTAFRYLFTITFLYFIFNSIFFWMCVQLGV